MYSPQFPRFQAGDPPTWGMYRFSIWPYQWRKTSSNITVIAQPGPAAGFATGRVPEPAPAAGPVPADEPAAVREPVPDSIERLIEPGSPAVEQPQEPAGQGAVPEDQPPPSGGSSDQRPGSLIWRIPPARKGG